MKKINTGPMGVIPNLHTGVLGDAVGAGLGGIGGDRVGMNETYESSIIC